MGRPLDRIRFFKTIFFSPEFQQCGGSSSLSRDVATFHIERADCSGAAVVSLPKKVDGCGVCGGDDACLAAECAQYDCGVCVDDGESVRDCAGQCGNEYVEKLVAAAGSASKRCTRSDAEDDVALLTCDGAADSKAFINS